MDISKRDLLKYILSSDFVFSQQSIYANGSAMTFGKNIGQSKFFGASDLISQTYLANFENTEKMGAIQSTGEFMANFANVSTLYQKQYAEDIDGAVALPKPRKLTVSLQAALKDRFSSRFYDGSSIELQTLADLLFYAAGSCKNEVQTVLDKEVTRYFFPYASGGGMYALKIFVIAYHVKSLQPAVYCYQPVSHTLLPYKDLVPLSDIMIMERFNNRTNILEPMQNFDPSVCLVYANNFHRQRLKYSELSLLLAAVDCGGLLQNIGLMAAALELHHCLWAGFKKHSSEEALGLDGVQEHALMVSLLGGKL